MLITVVGATLTLGVCGALLCENALRVPGPLRRKAPPSRAQELAHATAATWKDVSLAATDGALMSAWLFTPRSPNGRAAVLLHGVVDNRRGVLAQAWILVENGYAVLTPDSRAHGESEGDLMTFGLREADDVRRWASWLVTQTKADRMYGYGHSMGAAILLQAVEHASPFRAVVAECPFVTFRDAAYDRVGGLLRLGPATSRAVLFPLIEPALLYGRVRWGADLRDASPARAIRATSVPVLLIHGDADRNIPVTHSRALAALNPHAVEYWEVPGADHTGTRAAAGEENYRRRLLDWYERH